MSTCASAAACPQVWLWPGLPGPHDRPSGLQVRVKVDSLFSNKWPAAVWQQPVLTRAGVPHAFHHHTRARSLFCGNACVTSNSRMLYAFSRDGAVPGAQWWKVVNKRFEAPVNAVSAVEEAGPGHRKHTHTHTHTTSHCQACLSASCTLKPSVARSQHALAACLFPNTLQHAGVVRRDAVLHSRWEGLK
jgi:hypothetical protein